MGKIRASDLQKLQKSLAEFVRFFHGQPPAWVVEDQSVKPKPMPKPKTKAKAKTGAKKPSATKDVQVAVKVIPARVRLNGVHGHARFLKGLLAMSHSGDYSYWEPHLKRRLIRLTHLVNGMGDHEGVVERLMSKMVENVNGQSLICVLGVGMGMEEGLEMGGLTTQEQAEEALEDLGMDLDTVAYMLMEDVGVIMRRLADVDGTSASMLEYPVLCQEVKAEKVARASKVKKGEETEKAEVQEPEEAERDGVPKAVVPPEETYGRTSVNVRKLRVH